jgi:hypothetical protein
MSFTSRTGRETGKKLQSGQQSALDAIKRQRAGGSALDAVAIEPAKEYYEEIDDDEFERRQRKARREGFVEEDTGEPVGFTLTALFLLLKSCLTCYFRNWRLW